MARTAKRTATSVSRVALRSKVGQAASAKVGYCCGGMPYHVLVANARVRIKFTLWVRLRLRVGFGAELPCKSDFVLWRRSVYLHKGI